MTVETTTTQAAPDTREAMVADLKKIVAEDAKEEAKQEKVEAKPEAASKKPESEETEEDSDEEVKADSEKSEEDSEEKDEDGEKKEAASKKPNRYQRLKAQRDHYAAESAKHRADVDEAVRVANIFRSRALALQQRLQEELAKAAKQGYSVSPEAEENFFLKQERQEGELSRQIAEQQRMERAKQEVLAEKQQLSQEFTAEALDLAQRMGFTGEAQRAEARRILRAYAMAHRAGEDISMQEVASTLSSLSKRQRVAQQERQQFETNAGAPRPLRGRSGVIPDYPATREGMTAFLKSLEGE